MEFFSLLGIIVNKRLNSPPKRIVGILITHPKIEGGVEIEGGDSMDFPFTKHESDMSKYHGFMITCFHQLPSNVFVHQLTSSFHNK